MPQGERNLFFSWNDIITVQYVWAPVEWNLYSRVWGQTVCISLSATGLLLLTMWISGFSNVCCLGICVCQRCRVKNLWYIFRVPVCCLFFTIARWIVSNICHGFVLKCMFHSCTFRFPHSSLSLSLLPYLYFMVPLKHHWSMAAHSLGFCDV